MYKNVNCYIFSERFYMKDVPHTDYGFHQVNTESFNIAQHKMSVQKASDGYWYILLDNGHFLFTTSEFFSNKLMKVRSKIDTNLLVCSAQSFFYVFPSPNKYSLVADSGYFIVDR